VGLIFFGISGLFLGGYYMTRLEGTSQTVTALAYRFNCIGNWLMIIGPVIKIICDWKSIFDDIWNG